MDGRRFVLIVDFRVDTCHLEKKVNKIIVCQIQSMFVVMGCLI